MNRFALILTTLALSGSGLRAASNPANDNELIDRLNDRIASLETRVMQLEAEIENRSHSKQPDTPPAGNAATPGKSQTGPAHETHHEHQDSVADKEAPGKEERPRNDRKTYVIGEGDTISIIAKKHNIPREELMKANGLRDGQQIYIGDSLIVPEPPKGGAIANSDTATNPKSDTGKNPTSDKNPPASSGGSFYTVRSGDTLTRIARNNSTTVPAIKNANNLKSDFLSVGMKLKIPGASSSRNTVADNTTKPEKPTADSQEEAGVPPNTGELRDGETYGLYTVEKGDTLYSLARDFFTSPTEIQRLNNLGGSNTIQPGQDLVVPTSQYYENHSNQLAGS